MLLSTRASADTLPALFDPIRAAVQSVARWYQGELGLPFRHIAPLAVLAAGDEDLYFSNPLEALALAVERNGWPNRAPGGRNMPYIYLGFLPGHGGYAGTVHWPGQVGLAGLGDACLHGIRGRGRECLRIIGGDPVRSSIDGQRGAIAHEMVHALGWGEHTETPALDVTSWEYQFFPDCHLPKVVREFILSPSQAIYFVDSVRDAP